MSALWDESNYTTAQTARSVVQRMPRLDELEEDLIARPATAPLPRAGEERSRAPN